MKIVLILIMLFVFQTASASERVYTEKSANHYLRESNEIYVAMKIGGHIAYDEFKSYVMGNPDDNELFEKWKSLSFDGVEKILILKVFKGERGVGDILSIKPVANYGLTQFGERYVFFLRESNEYGPCEIVDTKKLPDRVMDSVEELIQFISGSTLNPCLYKVKYD